MQLFAGSRDARDAVHRGLRAPQPVRVRRAAEAASCPRRRRRIRATLRRAQTVFDEEVGKSFSLDLRDLSRDNWSLLPQIGRLPRRSADAPLRHAHLRAIDRRAEDVTLFHRERKRNISAYASEMKLSSRGRFYNEDDLVEYDVLDYDDRRDVLARARVARRPRAAAAPRQVVRAGGAHAAAGRRLHRAVDHQRRARPPDVPARAQPEQRGRQPAVAGGARRRADADDRLCGADPDAVDRPGIDRSCRGRRRASRSGPKTCRTSRRSPTGCSAIAASGIRRARSPTTRPRRSASRVPVEYTVGGQRRAGHRTRRRARRRHRARPRVTYTFVAGAAAAVSRRGRQQVLPHAMRRRSRSTSSPPAAEAAQRRRPAARPAVPPIGARNTVSLIVEVESAAAGARPRHRRHGRRHPALYASIDRRRARTTR